MRPVWIAVAIVAALVVGGYLAVELELIDALRSLFDDVVVVKEVKIG